MNFQGERAQHGALPPRTKLRKHRLNRHFAPQSAPPLKMDLTNKLRITTKYGRIYVICCQDGMRRSVPHSEAHDATAAARYPTGIIPGITMSVEHFVSCHPDSSLLNTAVFCITIVSIVRSIISVTCISSMARSSTEMVILDRIFGFLNSRCQDDFGLSSQPIDCGTPVTQSIG
jgi:hypothetical protein